MNPSIDLSSPYVRIALRALRYAAKDAVKGRTLESDELPPWGFLEQGRFTRCMRRIAAISENVFLKDFTTPYVERGVKGMTSQPEGLTPPKGVHWMPENGQWRTSLPVEGAFPRRYKSYYFPGTAEGLQQAIGHHRAYWAARGGMKRNRRKRAT